MNIAGRIRQFRKISLEEAATTLGIDTAMLNAIELSEVYAAPELINRMAQLYGVRVEFLTNGRPKTSFEYLFHTSEKSMKPRKRRLPKVYELGIVVPDNQVIDRY